MINCSKASCNSRICSSCGKRYADNWPKNISLLNFPHLHITLTVSSLLWPYLKKENLKIFMDCAIIAIKKYLNKDIQPGCIVFLHTFGRDLNYKPHLHILATKGGFCNKNFKEIIMLPKKKNLGLIWKHLVTNNLDIEDSRISRILFKRFITDITLVKGKDKLLKYMLRYSRHPVIANSRIIFFNDKSINYYYISHKTRKRTYVNKSNKAFMKSIIQHIPERHFKIVRHYGAYSRNQKHIYRIKISDDNNLSEFF